MRLFQRLQARGSGLVASIVLVLLSPALGAGACGGGDNGSTGGSTPGAGSAPKASFYYDENWCQRYKIGSSSVAGLYCAQPVRDTTAPTWDFYLQSDPAKKLVYRQEFPPGQDEYAIQYWYVSNQWTRSPANGGGTVELCWRVDASAPCVWTTPDGYRQLVDQQLQSQRLTQQQAAEAKQQATATAQANRNAAQQLLGDLKQRQIDMAKIWTAPACVWSRNGCA